MENWQFLIQKQGDRHWQSLDSSRLEISLGRYRVLARSHLVNQQVEVLVTHSLPWTDQSKKLIVQGTRRSNQNGLIAVLPFTDLQEGIWELQCWGRVGEDESWQYSLVLGVSSPDEHGLTENNSQIDTETEYSEYGSDDAGGDPISSNMEDLINQPASPVFSEGKTAEEIFQRVIDFTSPQSQGEYLSGTSVHQSPSLPLELFLEQNTYIVNWGKPFSINGYGILSSSKQLTSPSLSPVKIYQVHLSVQVRSPGESKILFDFPQHLSTEELLPFAFSHNLTIPHDCISQLLLATVNLCGSFTPHDQVILLASYPFTITAEFDQLLPLISQTSLVLSTSPGHYTGILSPPSSSPSHLGLELFNLVKKPELAHFHVLEPAPHQPLPPKIQPVSKESRLSLVPVEIDQELYPVDMELGPTLEVSKQKIFQPEQLNVETSLLKNTVNLPGDEIVIDDVSIDIITNPEEQGQYDSANQSLELEKQPWNDVKTGQEMLDSVSLPTPGLFLPSGELLAGSLIKIRLEVDQMYPNLTIKLWLEDCQNRELLDGPHVLTDFQPHSLGKWQTITQLVVPLGCTQILLGAIAVESNSQRESHKVTAIRNIMVNPQAPVPISNHDLC
ncbi:hypothetical protein [Cylindrospermopsis curvispora]|uniref:Uncharacterized protein n=1 Tax=Cylindrospermopsis curvispora GIHE-G1 TaxID=2666332 RepID=A0A7H0EXU7_9CYAN|nr:hypothetical protein [Cylindrospermopsis curvispora]QNP28613.1 hypothetical protein IAR63_11950 [Cylindrospermopsis curvispora GIHE-G1]